MAVKKGILDNFLKPSSHYKDNQKNLRSIFIDKSEDDFKPDPQNFLEASLESESITINVPSSTFISPENMETRQQQIEKKLNTNRTQTTHKLHTNLTHKLDTNSTQTTHKEIISYGNKTQSRHKVNTKLNTPKTQTKHKVDTNQTQSAHISTLVGVQRLILLFIFEECKKARSHITEPLSIIHIANGLEITPGSIKTSIARLCEKAFLKVNSFKNGRGGWSIYEVPEIIYKELLQMETQHKLHTNRTQSRHKVDTKLNTELNTTVPSSSSLNIKETTTTEISDEWYFDISPYARFGFTISQLKQLASLGIISAIDVEQSLIEFSYDLDNYPNAIPKVKTTKINFLMGILRKGRKYTSETYRNEQDATILEMARRIEDKQKSLLEANFVVWEAKLSDEERKDILSKLPPNLMVLHRTYGASNNIEVRNWYFDYFIRNVKG